MPEMTGVVLISEARKLGSDTRAILCTGFSETINAQTINNYGISRLLLKPVSRLDLSKAVHEVLVEGRRKEAD
jgi:YesN/AraC family two-component response regulator